MKNLKKFFGTPKQTAVSIGCIAAALVLFGAGTAFASNAIARRHSAEGSYQADGAGPVTLDEAISAALADAGFSSQEVTVTKAKRDSDHGIFVYDIEFSVGNTEYEYEIYEDTGAVYSKSKETAVVQGGGDAAQAAHSQTGGNGELAAGQTGNGSQQSADQSEAGLQQSAGQAEAGSQLSADQSGAGLQQSSGQSGNSAQQGTGQPGDQSGTGSQQSDTGLQQSGTGSQSSGTGTQPETGQAQDSSGQISLDAAKEIAVSDAGLALSDVTFTKAKTDYEDGAAVYEIKFNTQTYEYEYEVYASNGAIRKKEKEAFPGSSAGNAGSDIGLEQAKAIALEHAGCAAADVRFSKAKMEKEHGSIVYEVEFYKGGMEYEYKIDAATGDILEFDSEMDD